MVSEPNYHPPCPPSFFWEKYWQPWISPKSIGSLIVCYSCHRPPFITHSQPLWLFSPDLSSSGKSHQTTTGRASTRQYKPQCTVQFILPPPLIGYSDRHVPPTIWLVTARRTTHQNLTIRNRPSVNFGSVWPLTRYYDPTQPNPRRSSLYTADVNPSLLTSSDPKKKKKKSLPFISCFVLCFHLCFQELFILSLVTMDQ